MSAEQSFGEPVGIQKDVAAAIGDRVHQLEHLAGSRYRRAIANVVDGGHHVAVDDGDGSFGASGTEIRGMHHTQQIESENQVGVPGIDLGGRFNGTLAQQ